MSTCRSNGRASLLNRIDRDRRRTPLPCSSSSTLPRTEGVGCIVDAGTTDVGRDTDLLKQIASRTSVHIVACGGLYMERTYPQDVATKSEDQIADDLVRDARASRYGAFGEIGETPNAAMSAAERKVFRAVGKAHLRTRLPIFTHNAYGTGPNVPRDAGLRQLDAFESAGVSPQHVAVGHSCCLDDPSAEVIKQIAQARRFRGIRSRHRRARARRQEGGDDPRVPGRGLRRSAAAFFRLQLHGTKRCSSGYGITLTVFVPKLRKAGVTDEMIRRITIDNPRRFLAFVPASRPCARRGRRTSRLRTVVSAEALASASHARAEARALRTPSGVRLK